MQPELLNALVSRLELKKRKNEKKDGRNSYNNNNIYKDLSQYSKYFLCLYYLLLKKNHEASSVILHSLHIGYILKFELMILIEFISRA